MSSYILSYLIATAMEDIQGDGVDLIYPAIGSESPFDFWKSWDFRTPSFPNLFLAIGNGVTEEDLVKRAEKAECSVKTKFKRMAECAVDEVFDNWRGTYVETVFERQISDFFDVYWVITEETGPNYGAWYADTASSLAAVKNCRTFAQTREFGRKCSLDGAREILHKKEGKDELENIQKAVEWWGDFAENRPQFCRPKEALCAVSLTKRMGRYYLMSDSVFKDEFKKEFLSRSLSFPSTSEVATAGFKEQLLGKPCTLGVYAEFVREVKNFAIQEGNWQIFRIFRHYLKLAIASRRTLMANGCTRKRGVIPISVVTTTLRYQNKRIEIKLDVVSDCVNKLLTRLTRGQGHTMLLSRLMLIKWVR